MKRKPKLKPAKRLTKRARQYAEVCERIDSLCIFRGGRCVEHG